MTKTNSQKEANIKKKLLAALAMLLISTILVVTSTYAWFTLSTAPEVTGITTSVGANGNLEIALLNNTTAASTEDDLGITSNVGDSMSVNAGGVTAANETWGNLVDLGDASYGMSNMQLMPSRLNIEDGNIVGSLLKAPNYGTDGRVIDITKETFTGKYSGTGFTYDTADRGVRAIGTSSGVTGRLSAYRNNLSYAALRAEEAQTLARAALSANAQAIATIMMGQVNGQTSFDSSYKANLNSLITGVTAANAKIAESIKAAVIAYALSAANTNELNDAAVTALVAAVEAAEVTEDALKTASTMDSLPAGVVSAINAYASINSSLTAAQEAFDALPGSNLSADSINSVLTHFVNKDNVTINGFAATSASKEQIIAATIDEETGALKVNVEMNAKSGVFYTIAQVGGNYSVKTSVTVNNNGVNMTAPATMVTKVAEKAFITAAVDDIKDNGAPASAAVSGTAVLDDTYGYAIDLGFRTNAAGSSLLLQTAAANRVYSDVDDNGTQGEGAYVQFTSTNPTTFTQNDVRALMSAVRIAFVQPTESGYKLLKMGKLDITAEWSDEQSKNVYTGGETVGTYGIKAGIVLCSHTVDGEGILTVDAKDDSAKIADLVQNVASKITVIVYLDGDIVDNTMVANAQNSVTGTVNLQFASSATLVAMKNTSLMNGEVTYTQAAAAGTTYTVAGQTGTVKTGYTVYTGSDGRMYYKKNGEDNYTAITPGNVTTVITITPTP